MDEQLESLKRSIQQKKVELKQYLNRRQAFMDKADKIEKLVKKMNDDKDQVQAYYDSYKRMSGEKMDDFKGNVYSKKYMEKVKQLRESYKAMIKRYDKTIDDLNMEAARVRNEGYKLDGPIGTLEHWVDDAVSTVQNWFN